MIRDWPDDDPDVIRKVAVGPDPLEPWQHRRKIWMAFERRHTTRTLAVAKQVCGGLFAKAMPSWAPVEDRAVCLLVQAATDYDACLNMMSTASLRTRLHNAAAKITSALRNDLSDTVDRQLCLISTLLCDESTRLEWSPFLNNCQKFCNKLLGPEFFRSVHYHPSGREAPGSPAHNPTLRPYLHSFAAPSTFPLLHDDAGDGLRLRRSGLGAYMSSLHHAEDFVSFALARKLTLPTARTGKDGFGTRVDLILATKCGLTCGHNESRFWHLQQMTTAVIRMSDHVFEDPFSVMTLLSSHLYRPRSLYIDERGSPWGSGGHSTGDLQRQWAENRIYGLVAMDVFLSFTRCVHLATRSIVRGRLAAGSTSLGFRESLSPTDGRAAFVRKSEDSEVRSLNDVFVGDWDMEPLVPPRHSVRRRMAGLLRLAGSDREVAWRQCTCTHCSKTDEELEQALTAESPLNVRTTSS